LHKYLVFPERGLKGSERAELESKIEAIAREIQSHAVIILKKNVLLLQRTLRVFLGYVIYAARSLLLSRKTMQ
jgi:hypothetical protein